MSEKLLDQHGRHRSKTVAFRVSPEEGALIDALVAASGLTKQDYITARLLEREVTVVPSSRIHRALRTQMEAVYRELRRIRNSGGVSPELATVVEMLAREFAGLGAEEAKSDTERENEAIMGMARS